MRFWRRLPAVLVLHLEPDDVLLLKTKQQLSLASAEALRAQAAEAFAIPPTRVVVIDYEMDVQVLRAASPVVPA